MHAMMERQLDHLVRLVDDLLEVSRITHGALELRRERVELATIVRNAVETSKPAIDAALHQLVVTLPPTPLWLEGDPTRLAQILANLLNNAARYMRPRGRIALAATVEADEVGIAISDEGAGFDAAHTARMFEMFGRGSASSGLGVGLALARRLAEMHGGTIDASSEGPGKGSVFTLRLPCAAPPPCVASPVDAEAHASMRGQRILVVDDNRDAADSLTLMLELLGADVRVARSGHEALECFAECRPDAVLLDIGMPEMDGYEVARAIRQRPDGRRTMIVAVTGWGQQSDRQQSREAGFDHHLVKPADLQAIEALLASLPVARETVT
jgi:CheY-like chemotaxis protein/anti-sigma regulatory factor (Ser/Thr protein kinase)